MQITEEKTSEMVLELDRVIERSHLALGEFVKGNPRPYEDLVSRRDDVVWANPFDPILRGWNQAKDSMDRASSQYRDGEAVGFENVIKYVDHGLAFIVEIERFKAKIGKRQDIAPIALRVTTIFRREDGGWKIFHRHADPITTVQPWESVVQK